MQIYTNNLTTHFITYLPKQIDLAGEWSVALTEIQIPMTMHHVKNNSEDTRVANEIKHFSGNEKQFPEDNAIVIQPRFPKADPKIVSHICPGIFANIQVLLDELNLLRSVRPHFGFTSNRGGYVVLKLICNESCKSNALHSLEISEKIRNILGFEKSTYELRAPGKVQVTAERQPNLHANIPNMLMIYSDILEPWVTGDVYTPLLRSVSLDFEKYIYGSVRVKNFSPPSYVPLLCSSFRSIEIDSRDQFGSPVPFDSGTLTVTLHFKRTD